MKKICLFIFAVALSFSLFACKDDAPEGEQELLVFYPGLTDENGKLLKMYEVASQKTGVKLKAQVGSTTSYDQLGSLIAAKDYPDMIQIQASTNMQKYISEGFLQPLGELIDTHAPNIKKYFNEYPKFKSSITWTDGKIYHLPSFNKDMPKTQKTVVARADWMNLYRTAKSKSATWAPTTPAEMTDLFKYWSENITPKNAAGAMTGEKVVPYFDRKGSRPEQTYDNIMCLLGSHYLFYLDGDTVKFAGETEAFKNALRELPIWWKNGYIDQNFNDKNKAKAARENYWTNTDKGGMTMDYATGTFTYIETGKLNNSDFDLEVLAPMGGFLTTSDDPLFLMGGQALTTKATKAKQIAAVKYFDYLFSDEGQILAQWGIEGETYEVKNGTFNLINGYNKDTLRELGVRLPDMPSVYSDDMQYDGGMPANLKAAIKKSDAFVGRLDEVAFFRAQVQNYIPTKEADTYSTQISTIRDAIDKYIQSVMTGSKNVEGDYTAFISEVKKLKLTDALVSAQKAFNEVVRIYGI